MSKDKPQPLQGLKVIECATVIAAPLEIPATPSNVSAEGGQNSVTVSWDSVFQAEFYRVWRDGNAVGDVVDTVILDKWLEEDAEKAWNAAAQQVQDLDIDNPAFIVALGSVNFQLGTRWMDKFPSAYEALRRKRYKEAIKQIQPMLDQVKEMVEKSGKEIVLNIICK